MSYWNIDLPGLKRAEAERVLEWAKAQGLGDGGSLVNPSSFLTLHLDRDTVEALHAALLARSTAQDPEEGQVGRGATSGIVEVFGEWLEIEDPSRP